MELFDELMQKLNEVGLAPGPDELQDCIESCQDMETYIAEGEADMIAEETAGTVNAMLRINEHTPVAKRAATFFRALIIARYMNESPGLAQKVEEYLENGARIVAPNLLPAPLVSKITTH